MEEQRLRQLETTVAAILDRLQRLESRLDLQKEKPAPIAAAPVIQGSDAPNRLLPGGAMVARLLQLVGRTCLVLGGAFLIRALSDGRVLSVGVGIALALALATASLGFSYRAAKLERRLSAVFHGITAALIAYPLALETAIRLGAMSPATAAAAVAGITALLLFVAWKHRLAALAWVGAASCLATTVALMQATDATGELTLVLLLLTAATLWLAESRSWNGLRWPAALLLDGVVLRTVLSAAHHDGAARDRLLSGFFFSIVIVMLTLIALAYRTLVRGRPVTAFHAVQTSAAISIGVVGVIYASAAYPTGTAVAGGVALALSAATLFLALSVVPKRGLARIDYLFYVAMSAGLLFAGGMLATASAARGLLWAILGVSAAALGRQRISLSAYGALFICAGSISSGLVGAVSDGFIGGAERWNAPGVGGLLVLGLALATYLVTAATSSQSIKRAWVARLPAGAILLLCAIALAALLVHAERAMLGSRGTDHAFVATGRTVALVAVATLLALAHRRVQLAELVWVAYLLLGIEGIKLIGEDLPNGRALTLLVAFATYGVALLAIQKLVRPVREAPR